MALFDPINLDDLTIDPQEMVEAARVFEMLGEYALAKSLALRLRLGGEITAAAGVERRLQNIYGRLPEWARW